MAAVYCGQEAMPDLPGMTDKMLKTLIEEAAGVQELTEAYAIARSMHTIAKTMVDEAARAKTREEGALKSMSDDLESVKENVKGFEDGRKVRAKAELTNIPGLNDSRKEQEEVLETFNEADVLSQLAKLQSQLDSYKVKRVAADDLAQSATRYERALGATKAELDAAERAANTAVNALTKVDAQVGTACKAVRSITKRICVT